jgi:hypothetical protein
MTTIRNFVLPLMGALLCAIPLAAQNRTNGVSMEAIAQRLEELEKQNAEFREQIQVLRAQLENIRPSAEEPLPTARVEALEDQVQIQAGRLAEQDQIKMQGSQRTPVRLTGIVLFNAFLNGRHGQTVDYPPTAAVSPGRTRAGATLAQSVVGLDFQTPDAVLGGRFRGSLMVDLSSASGDGTPTNAVVRLRTASIEGQWKTRSIMVGQEKPIFSPREPNSLARLNTSPLASAGNLWLWRPQVRFEQRIKLGRAQEVRAQIGVSQARENLGTIPGEFLSTLEIQRPGLEGNFRFSHAVDEFRRVEIAAGFHRSTTHVAGTAVPSSVVSMDWFWNPVRKVEFTGTVFTGKNLAKFGGLAGVQSFTILTPSSGQVRVIPVRGIGGWAQATWLATSRLSFNVFSGQHDTNNTDLSISGQRHKNLVNGANFFYRVAPNVVTGIEASQIRTWYLGGPHPLNNHYDLYMGYLF